jgi:hypothetical protein
MPTLGGLKCITFTRRVGLRLKKVDRNSTDSGTIDEYTVNNVASCQLLVGLS